MITLDVRGLAPPEPMQRTLEALEGMPAGESLRQINARIPHFLLPLLEEHGYTYELISEGPDEVVGIIRRNDEGEKK